MEPRCSSAVVENPVNFHHYNIVLKKNIFCKLIREFYVTEFHYQTRYQRKPLRASGANNIYSRNIVRRKTKFFARESKTSTETRDYIKRKKRERLHSIENLRRVKTSRKTKWRPIWDRRQATCCKIFKKNQAKIKSN